MNDETERKLPALVSGSPVRAIIPSDFEGAWRIANAVVVAGMAPYGLQTPEKATVAIMHGLEIGLPPMVALQSIAVINGRPCLWGDGALGLVQGSGKLETIKEWHEGEGDKRVALCRVVRRGDPEPKIGRFSVSDAKTAKLWMKKGHKGEDTPWVTYPDRMLKMRARAFALRDGFADVLKGLGIAEEVRDIAVEHDPGERPTPPRPPAKADKVDLKVNPPRPPAKTKEPEPEEEVDFGAVVEGVAAPATPSALLSALDVALDNAESAEDVEAIWDQHDLMATFEGFQQGDELQGKALGIKRRHISRLAKKS